MTVATSRRRVGAPIAVAVAVAVAVTVAVTVAVAAAVAVTGCGTAETPPPVSAPQQQAPTTAAATQVCHPIVSGCGCAYQCATGMRETSPGHWQVTHDLQDSRLDDTETERWCFDDAGHGSPAAGAPATATRCIDVFFDGTPCGGECIPTAAFLGCHASGDRCVP